MISKINIWAQGIVIATIIATVIQLILPENKNKKYIKVVIGIYILFCIIHPVIGKSVNLDDYNFENYAGNGNFIGNTNFIENTENGSSAYQYNKSVNDEFKKRFIEDVSTKLNTMGYSSNNIDVLFDKDYNIKHLKILNTKKYNNDESINIKEVNICSENNTININNCSDDGNRNIIKNDNCSGDGNRNIVKNDNCSGDENKNSEITGSEKDKLKNYFSDTYKVDKNEIEIS